MKIEIDDYLVLRMLDRRGQLARCADIKNSKYKGYIQESTPDGIVEQRVIFKESDVICNLGKVPRAGSVYGLKVEPLLRSVKSSFWGEVRFYQKLSSKFELNLKDSMNAAKAELKKLKMPKLDIDVEIRNPHGRYAGYYKYLPRAEKDVLCLKPTEHTTKQDYKYLWLHEYSHGIWFRHVPNKILWIKLYHHYMDLFAIKEKELKSILEDIKYLGSIREFQNDCDEHTKRVLKSILKHISTVHSLTPKHLEMLLNTKESVKEYWPSFIELSEKKLGVTEYGKKNVEEFFAEAFSHRFSGKKIPKDIDELLQKTMKLVQL